MVHTNFTEKLKACPVCGKKNWEKGHHHGNEYWCKTCGASLLFPYNDTTSRAFIKKHPEWGDE